LKASNPTQTIPSTPQPLSFILVRLYLKYKPLLSQCINKSTSTTKSNRSWNSDYRIWTERRRNCDSSCGIAVFCHPRRILLQREVFLLWSCKRNCKSKQYSI